MDFEVLLSKEIAEELEELAKMDVGTDEYRATVDGLVKLIDRSISIEKLKQEAEAKAEDREQEQAQHRADYDLRYWQVTEDLRLREAHQQEDLELKQKQMQEDRRDRLIKNILAGAGIVIPSILTIWGTLKSLEFEKEGTVTTIMGRGFINKLLPKK